MIRQVTSIIVFLLGLVHCQYSEDSYLRDFCNFNGGTFTQRTELTGDLCTDMKFNVPTASDVDAKEFCQLYAPWRQRGSTHGKTTTCSVEATTTCAAGWIQMFEWCYQLPRERTRFKYDDAANICKAARRTAQIGTIRHKYHVGVWKNFIRGISQVWIQASESFEPYVDVKKPGGALALAFTGMAYAFQTKPNSLVRIDPAIKLQVLCEYKPDMTPAEARYLGDRYNEIYWPAVPIADGVLIRSGSHYTRGVDQKQVCAGVLKPFGVKSFNPYFPDSNIMESFKSNNGRDSRGTVLVTRANAEIDGSPDNTLMCESLAGKEFTSVMAGGDKKIVSVQTRGLSCDNMHSSAVIDKLGAPTLRAMSDSQPAPIWCKMGKVRKYKYVDEPGYSRYNRNNGEVVAHKLVQENKTPAQAAEACKAERAYHSGFDSYEEYLFLLSLIIPKHGKPSLGASRRSECIDSKGFSDDPNSYCSRGRVMQWQNHVAHNPIDDRVWAINNLTEPENNNMKYNPDNSKGFHQSCLYLHHEPDWFHDPDSTGLLDDRWCGHQVRFFCQKTLKLVEL